MAGKKASMQDVLEQEGLAEDRQFIIETLERANQIRLQVGMQPDDDHEGSGLLRELYEAKQELAAIASVNGLEGLKHGKVVFTQRLQTGRSGVVLNKFIELLLASGVSAETIARCKDEATSTGPSFWVREISELK